MAGVTLRDYVDFRLNEMNQRLTDRFISQETAVLRADGVLTARLESMNEFRQALTDQTKHFVTRPEHEKLDESIRRLEQSKANLDGRMLVAGVAASAFVSLIISLVLLIISHFWSA